MFNSLTPSNVSKFCWRHKGKIAMTGLGIGAVLGAAYYYYNDDNDDNSSSCSDESDNEEDSKEKTASKCPNPKDIQRRTNELVAVNELFDFSLIYFLPTIKQKVKDVVDVSETVRRLKELMKNDSNPDFHMTKSALWKEIQIAAFNSMFTSALAVSGASLLLMVQMHLLVRTSQSASASSPPSSVCEIDNSGIFRDLMEETFGSFFHSGIRDLSVRNRVIIENVFKEINWTVENTLCVRHDDIKQLLFMMKSRVESGANGREPLCDLLSLLFRGECGQKAQNSGIATSVSFLPSVDIDGVQESRGKRLVDVKQILDETWQVLESPFFEKAFRDVTDSMFAFITMDVWEEVFYPLAHPQFGYTPFERTLSPGSPNSPQDLRSQGSTPDNSKVSARQNEGNVQQDKGFMGGGSDRKYVDPGIPLAKLLPTIKAVVFKLVPDDHDKPKVDDVSSKISDEMFSRTNPTLFAPKRSKSLRRIRSICGADDARSNSFNLCSMLLDKK